jgi:hypothetical protein
MTPPDRSPGPPREFWIGLGWGTLIVVGIVLVAATILQLIGFW